MPTLVFLKHDLGVGPGITHGESSFHKVLYVNIKKHGVKAEAIQRGMLEG